MNDQQAGWLLLAGPVLGLIPVAHPALLRIWSMPRDTFLITVANHRRAWSWLNAGFGLASITTTAGLFALTQSQAFGNTALLACAAGYAIGATLWSAVLAIRNRTTPLLADLRTDSVPGQLLEAATTALFQAFALITASSLAGLGAVLLVSGAATAWAALVTLLTGVVAIAWLLRTGDIIPAVLYVPTMLLGATLL